jgi:hypothetical protein
MGMVLEGGLQRARIYFSLHCWKERNQWVSNASGSEGSHDGIVGGMGASG